MTCPSAELDHLELLAEIDTLVQRLRAWSASAPDWAPGEAAQALVRRLVERAEFLRLRLEAPLVVALLGGTGTGKSALLNALVGQTLVTAGPLRPTTTRPILVSRDDVTPPMLGIDPAAVEVVHSRAEILREVVLVDCPDPDTTEDPESAGTNLARLRPILAHCDVLLVVTTQQKYRSARVADELAAAAPGARLVFVQTHADSDADIRADWRAVLDARYSTGEMFFVDSLAALARAESGEPVAGEIGRLRDLLTRQLAGAGGNRIRRANFLDLVAETLRRAAVRLDAAMPAVEELDRAVGEQRQRLAAPLLAQTRGELAAHRRTFESRLLGRVAARWGFSPFALVLRLFHSLGTLVSQAALWRARTPAQIALWGAFEGARLWQRQSRQRQADQAAAQAAAVCWEPAQLQTASLVLAGYAQQAGFNARLVDDATTQREAAAAATSFASEVSAGLEGVLEHLAARHSGWWTRLFYEFLFLVFLGALLFRLGKNFFYDSWLAPLPVQVYGMHEYFAALFWLVAWALLLCWGFSARLRRGLRRQIDEVAHGWQDQQPAAALFGRLQEASHRARQFRAEIDRLEGEVAALRSRLALPDDLLGHLREVL